MFQYFLIFSLQLLKRKKKNMLWNHFPKRNDVAIIIHLHRPRWSLCRAHAHTKRNKKATNLLFVIGTCWMKRVCFWVMLKSKNHSNWFVNLVLFLLCRIFISLKLENINSYWFPDDWWDFYLLFYFRYS